MAYEIPEDFVFQYPWGPATKQAAFCICVACGEKAQATRTISEYPFRYLPPGWQTEARTRATRCPKCIEAGHYQPDFYAKYEVHSSHDGELPHLHVRPRERLWMEQSTVPTYRAVEERITQPAHEAAGEKTMQDNDKMAEASAKGIKTRAKDHLSDVGGAFAMGLKLAAVNEGGEILLDIAREIAKDSDMMQALLESPDGREVAKMLAALTISGMCHYTDYVPKKEVIQQLMQLQITASGFQLAAPRMKELRKHFERLVGVSEKLAEIGETAGIQARVDDTEREEAEVESIDAAKAKKRKEAHA